MPTRLDAETALYQRWGGIMLMVWQRPANPRTGAQPAGNRPIQPTGTTEIYNDPLGFGLQLFGLMPTDLSSVTSDDFANAGKKYFGVMDLAEYRLINTILGSFTGTDESDFGRSADYSKIADRLSARASELLGQYKAQLVRYRPLTTGTILIPNEQRFGPEL